MVIRSSFFASFPSFCSNLLGSQFRTEGSKGSKGRKMHVRYDEAHLLSRQVIGAAVEVHRILGPGLLESVYERCLIRELELRGIAAVSQQKVTIDYKGFKFEETLRFDVLVEGCLLVEVKAIEKVLPVHKAIALSYMKLLDVPLGLVLNFHETKLTDGLSRLLLPGAGPPPTDTLQTD
jgi:GxxExxY protein